MALTDPQLCVALKAGDVELVRQLLQNGDDVNQLDTNGQTALGIVVQQSFACHAKQNRSPFLRYITLIDMLLDAGADIDAARLRRLSPLWLACKAGREDLVERMLNGTAARPSAAAADVSRKTDVGVLRPKRIEYHSDGSRRFFKVYVDQRSPAVEWQILDDSLTPLMAAAAGGHVGVMRRLIDAGRGDTAAHYDWEGRSALHHLLLTGRCPPTAGEERAMVEMVETLLQSYGDNAAVNMLTDTGESPLFYASLGFMPAVCHCLVCNGADPNVGDVHNLPLIAACLSDDVATANAICPPNGRPPYPNGGIAPAYDMVEEPIDDDDDEYVELYTGEILDSPSSLPIGSALQNRGERVLTRMLKWLIDAGADVMRLDDHGLSPLHRAVQIAIIPQDGDEDDILEMDELYDDYEVGAAAAAVDAAALYEDDVQIKIYANTGNDWQAIITTLLLAGADPNQLSTNGLTPLRHMASQLGWARRVAFHRGQQFPPIDSFRSTVETLFEALVERRDGLGPSLFDDDRIELRKLLLYCDQHTVRLMLRMLNAGVGLRTLGNFCHGAFRDRARSPLVSVQLCRAAVKLLGIRISDEDVNGIRDQAADSKSPTNQAKLMTLATWLAARRCRPPSLKQLCRTRIRTRLSATNGHRAIGPLVDKLLPDKCVYHRYLLSAR